MKPVPCIRVGLALLALAVSVELPAAPLGTAFTYQGRLQQSGGPASGLYDFQFSLWDADTVGTPVGTVQTASAVGVTNGLFTVTLDFGSVFNGNARWLEIAVRTNGAGSFTTLAPRQSLTAAPYASYAASSAAAAGFSGSLTGDVSGTQGGTVVTSVGSYPATAVASGASAANAATYGNVPGTIVKRDGAGGFSAGAISGTSFSGNGSGLSGVTAASVAPGAVTGAGIATGQVVKSVNGLKDDVSFAAGENIILTTNGNTLQVSAGSVAGAWRLGGNSGSTAGVDFLGTTDNQPLEIKVNNQRVLRLEPSTNGQPNIIGGDASNLVEPGATGATIAGGQSNIIQTATTRATIGGGGSNAIQSGAQSAVIAGGFRSTIQANANNATIGGGFNQTIQAGAHHATIAGGGSHRIETNAYSATIGGGASHLIQSNATYATISGGNGNTIQTNAFGATIGGGWGNTIQTNADRATISGGFFNSIQPNASFAAIPGGYQNSATTNAFAAGTRAKANHSGAFVWADSQPADFASTAGNQFLIRASGNVGINKNNPATALDVNGTVTADSFSGNGASLTSLNASQLTAGIVPDAQLPSNLVRTNQSGFSGNGAGLTDLNASQLTTGIVPDAQLPSNLARANQVWSLYGNSGTTPGGNFLGTADYQPLVLGVNSQPALTLGVNGSMGMRSCTNAGTRSVSLGTDNSASGHYATALGGYGAATNYYATSMGYSSIAGGMASIAMGSHCTAVGDYAVAAGQSTTASGSSSVAMGGWSVATNFFATALGYATTAGGYASTAIGSGSIATGAYSLAAGSGARALHDNSFVWSGSGSSVTSTGPNQFIINSPGGVGINKNNPGSSLDVEGTVTASTFNPTSDRNVKERFAPIQPREVLDKIAALPISEWSFKNEPSTRHVGPMAQDFYGAFGLGVDDKHIATVDADGVALAAIQGLNQKLEQKETEITELKQRLEKLEQLIHAKNGGE